MSNNTKSNFNNKLYFALILSLFIPTIYSTLRVYLINSIPSTDGLSISSHMEWFDLINEVIQAFLIIPLYYVINKARSNIEKFKERIVLSGLVVFILYFIFSVGVYLFSENMVSIMNVSDNIKSDVIHYIQLENIAFIFGVISSFANTIFIALNKEKYIYFILLTRVVLSCIGDLYFIPTFGVNGIAYTNICINLFILILCIILLYRENLLPKKLSIVGLKELAKDWISNASYAGLQVFLDNIVYALIVCKMVNSLSEEGTYWVANNFIWGYLLVPILALSDIIRKDCKDGFVERNIQKYTKITFVVFALWILSMPLWNFIFKNLMNASDTKTIFNLVLILLPFYLAYGLSSIIDNIFYGLGKSKYMFFNSIICNIVYYGILYILFSKNIFVPSLTTIALMFGFGMIVHLIVSLACYKHEFKSTFKLK